MISQIFVEIMHPVLVSLWKLQIFLFPAELILLGTYVVYRALEPILLRALKNRISASIIRLFSKMLKVSVILLGLITALGTIGVDVTALVAGFGITGFAVAFALQDAISNLLAGVMIMIYRPFKENDIIKVFDVGACYHGRIIEIDLRYTHVEEADGVVLIPNSIVLNNAVTKVRQPLEGKSSAKSAKPSKKTTK
ncbi:MAG TPA: mechanosensitive ion channel [Proteobacteria bacterium]|nr:mechanosensitive ion channel [Pseudomonadota bacterium]